MAALPITYRAVVSGQSKEVLIKNALDEAKAFFECDLNDLKILKGEVIKCGAENEDTGASWSYYEGEFFIEIIDRKGPPSLRRWHDDTRA